MTTKLQLSTLWLVAALGCSSGASNAPQPTAADAGGQATLPTTSTSAAPLPTSPAAAAAAGSSPTTATAGQSSTAGNAAVATTAGTGAAGSATGQAGQPSAPTAGAAGASSSPPPATKPDPTTGFDYPAGDVAMSADLVIPAGKTVKVGPGTKFKASTDVKLQVLGELIVQGTPESPATFDGNGTPKSWHGIVVESGGKLTLENAHVSGATYGLFIMPGAQFSVDSSVIDTSFKAAVVQSNGTFKRTRFVATVPDSISLASEVSVDDPNGALTIMDASPTITDCRFDGASTVTDLVRIGGNASPTFDHVYLHDAHCAFHTYGGTNTSARVTNALIENFAYGFMAYTTKPIVENSVFKNNSADFGICLGATEDNAPALKDNFYSAGEVQLDGSCYGIGIVDATPATAASTSAGTITTFK